MTKHKTNKLRVLTFLIIISIANGISAARPTNGQIAKQIVERAYNLVFGPQGSSLRYSVNIIGIYKTAGFTIMKGKKQYFVDEKYNVWNDGRNFYRVNRKKKTVEIHNSSSKKKDKYAEKFAFRLENFNYSYTENAKYYFVTLITKPKAPGYIKRAKIVVNKATNAPISLKIKVLFFWTTVRVTNLHSGGINDSVFNFPESRYKGYKFIDKRNKRR